MMNKYTIVWLDANSSDSKSNFRIKLGDAQTFTDTDGCIQYIKSHPHESIYLIVSGSLAKETIPEIYEAANLIQVFLFCGSVVAYSDWALDYCDKLMIFDHGDDLLERLWNDLDCNLRKQAAQYLKQAEEYKTRALQFKQPSCG